MRVNLVDDIDGGDATQSVPFTLDGTAYEIDLSDDNAARLREEFAPFIDAGRRTGGARSVQQRQRPPSTVRPSLAANIPAQSGPGPATTAGPYPTEAASRSKSRMLTTPRNRDRLPTPLSTALVRAARNNDAPK